MKNAKETCYYCGEPKTSYEHVPPQSFFPKNKRVNLIQVPSCDDHNGNKSKDDEYVRLVLMSSHLLDGRSDLSGVRDSVERSLLRAADRAIKQIGSRDDGKRLHARMEELYREFGGSHIHGAKVLSALIGEGLLTRNFLSLAVNDPREEVIKLPDGEIRNGSSFAIDINRIAAFFNFMSRALYFNHYKKQYNGAVRLYLITFFGTNITPHEEQFRDMVVPLYNKDSSLGHNKDIFYYDFYNHYQVDDQEMPSGLILNMCMYEAFKISSYFYGSAHC